MSHGPWEEHRENVLYRLAETEQEVSALDMRVRAVEAALSRRMGRAGFWGSVAGSAAVLVPFLVFILSLLHYSKMIP